MPQPNSDGFAIGNADSDSYGYSYPDGNAYVHTDGYGYGYGNSDANTDANGYGYVHADSYSDGDCHSYAHTDANCNSNSYSYGNSDLNADSNGGEAITDAEAASNNTPTASVVGSGKWNSSGGNSRETLASSPPEVDWLLLIFARSALGVRCVLASLSRRMKLSPQGARVI